MNKLIIFSAAWCGPCKMMAPAVEELQEKYPGLITKYDVDQEIDLRTHYGVQAVPTIIVVDDAGEEITRKMGGLPKSQLEGLLLG